MRYFQILLALVIAPTTVLADDDGKRLLAEQWRATNQAGQLDAVIASPKIRPDTKSGEVQVMLSSSDGQIFRAEPVEGSNRAFSFAEIPAGTYTLVAKGYRVVGCYALQLVDPPAGADDELYRVLEIAAADISLKNIQKAVARYLPATGPATAEFDADAAYQLMNSIGGLSAQRVAQADGGVTGRIYHAGLVGDRLGAGGLTNILLYKNGQMVAQTVSDEEGLVKIDSLSPGTYGVIAVGPQGLGISSFELLDEMIAAKSGTTGSDANGRFVALQDNVEGVGFELQLAPVGQDSPIVQELIQEGRSDAGSAEPNIGQGPAGGGGGGGGGSGGGIGALGLAGLGIGVAAAFSDSDEGISSPPATSPVTP